MPKEEISTERAPAAIGPYAQGIRFGGLVFASGQIPVDPSTGKVPDGVEAQARQALQNLGAVLEAGGSSLADVVKTTVFIQNMRDFTIINRVYEGFFSKPFPARSCVEVAALPKGVLLEIEAVAEARA